MTGQLRVLSIYEGFFAGGARALHSSVVAGLHAGGSQAHAVLSIHNEMRRETLLQRMEADARYRQLSAIGVPVISLGRGSDRTGDPTNFTIPSSRPFPDTPPRPISSCRSRNNRCT